MKVFIDCDIAVKLAQWGLLQRFTTHLQRKGSAQLFTVPTLKYRFKLSDEPRAIKLIGSKPAFDQVVAFDQLCGKQTAYDEALLAELASEPGLDPGEIGLFAAAAHYDRALVDTGDKRSLKALGTLSAAGTNLARLKSKVACLEQTVDHAIERWSFGVVNTGVAKHRAADIAVANCMECGEEAAARQALQEASAALMSNCGGVLAQSPFGWIP